MDPALIWGAFARLLGVVALVAIAPLYWQVEAHCGARGHSPIAPRLAQMRLDFPRHVRLLHLPTLLWLCSADWFLKGLTVAGSLAAVLAVYGGPFSHWALLACFVVLLSLDRAMDLMFPWDCLLFEMLAMGALLPPLAPLPQVRMLAEPLPLQALFFNALLVRLMLGFGKIKFIGSTSKDHTYLREFLINQPLPSPLGWYAYNLPPWTHKLGLALLFLVEVPLPLLALSPGPIRLLPFVSTLALMLAIQLGGTFGYFNLVVAVLCLPLLDLNASIFSFRWQQVAGTWQGAALFALTVVLAGGWLVSFLFNSWCARSWPYWPVLASRKLRAAWPLVTLYRWLTDVRLIHAYGVFPPQGQPAVKFTPVLQGSLDGVEWRDFEHRLMPTIETSPPRFIAPLHSRWDQLMVYVGYGMDLAGLAASTFNAALPSNYSRHSPVQRVMQRLLEGEPSVRRLFRNDPFGGQPPRFMRQVTAILHPVSIAEHRRTGAWWKRQVIHVDWPAMEADPLMWEEWLAGPELFHWDDVIWRRRAPAIRRLEGVPSPEAALAELGLPPALLDRFWEDFLPAAAPGCPRPRGLCGLEAAAECVRRQFSRAEMLDFERVAAGLAVALAGRWQQRSLGDAFGLPSYFHVGLLAYHVVLSGREAYAHAWQDDAALAAAAADLTEASGLWLMGVFRPVGLRHHAYACKLVAQWVADGWEPAIPGALLLSPFLRRQFPDIAPEAQFQVSRAVADGAWQLTIA